MGVSYLTPMFSDRRHRLLFPEVPAVPARLPEAMETKAQFQPDSANAFKAKASFSYCLQKSTWFHLALIFFTFFCKAKDASGVVVVVVFTVILHIFNGRVNLTF